MINRRLTAPQPITPTSNKGKRSYPAVSYLVRQGIFKSHKKAEAAISAGMVSIDGSTVKNLDTLVYDQAPVYVAGNQHNSRAAFKLQAALDYFKIEMILGRNMEGVALDVGASHGGFTSCLLENGFSRVHAVDLAKGIFNPRLKNDSRVTLYEGLNARKMNYESHPIEADLIVVDVSPLPLLTLVRSLAQMLNRRGKMLIMLKPAFETKGTAGVIDFCQRYGWMDDFAKKEFHHTVGEELLPDLYRMIFAHADYQKRIATTRQPRRLKRSKYTFRFGLRMLGFRILDTYLSPVPIRYHQEEFFLIEPEWNRMPEVQRFQDIP